MTKGERREQQSRKRRKMPVHGKSLEHVMRAIEKRVKHAQERTS